MTPLTICSKLAPPDPLQPPLLLSLLSTFLHLNTIILSYQQDHTQLASLIVLLALTRPLQAPDPLGHFASLT